MDDVEEAHGVDDVSRFEMGTWAAVREEDLTKHERHLVSEGVLGFCREHGVLYQKEFIECCLIEAMYCEHPEHSSFRGRFGLKQCDERWP